MQNNLQIVPSLHNFITNIRNMIDCKIKYYNLSPILKAKTQVDDCASRYGIIMHWKKNNSIYNDWYFAIWWHFTKNESEILNV